MQEDFRLMNVAAVANLAGVSIPTIYRLARHGMFPKPIAVGPQARRWRSDEIEAWVERATAARDGREAA